MPVDVFDAPDLKAVHGKITDHLSEKAAALSAKLAAVKDINNKTVTLFKTLVGVITFASDHADDSAGIDKELERYHRECKQLDKEIDQYEKDGKLTVTNMMSLKTWIAEGKAKMDDLMIQHGVTPSEHPLRSLIYAVCDSTVKDVLDLNETFKSTKKTTMAAYTKVIQDGINFRKKLQAIRAGKTHTITPHSPPAVSHEAPKPGTPPSPNPLTSGTLSAAPDERKTPSPDRAGSTSGVAKMLAIPGGALATPPREAAAATANGKPTPPITPPKSAPTTAAAASTPSAIERGRGMRIGATA